MKTCITTAHEDQLTDEILSEKQKEVEIGVEEEDGEDMAILTGLLANSKN